MQVITLKMLIIIIIIVVILDLVLIAMILTIISIIIFLSGEAIVDLDLRHNQRLGCRMDALCMYLPSPGSASSSWSS